MAKICPITGKWVVFGNNVSHANNKTRRRWKPNLQWKRVWVPSESRFIRMRVSARGLRTIGKLDVEAALLKVAKRSQIKKHKDQRRKEGKPIMRTIIKLVSSAGTGHFYTTTKNPKIQSGKLELQKYDPKVRKHVLYREAKA